MLATFAKSNFLLICLQKSLYFNKLLSSAVCLPDFVSILNFSARLSFHWKFLQSSLYDFMIWAVCCFSLKGSTADECTIDYKISFANRNHEYPNLPRFFSLTWENKTHSFKMLDKRQRGYMTGEYLSSLLCKIIKPVFSNSSNLLTDALIRIPKVNQENILCPQFRISVFHGPDLWMQKTMFNFIHL